MANLFNRVEALAARVPPVTWQIAAVLSPFVFASYIGLSDAADARHGLDRSVTQAQAPLTLTPAVRTAYLRRHEFAQTSNGETLASLPVINSIALMLAASGCAAIWNARASRPRRASIADVK